MKENVLLTGATGFLGKHLTGLLEAEDVAMIAVSRRRDAFCGHPRVECICGDLGNMGAIVEKLKGREISTCFHLAWEGIPDFSFENCRRNMGYGLAVLDMCKRLGIKKLIVSGSCLEYREADGLAGETAALDRESYFAACKNSIHDFAHLFCRENNIKLYWMRLFYVAGAGQREGAILPYLIEQYRSGRSPKLKTPFDAKDYISARDAAEALLAVWRQNPPGETYNVGTGKLTTVNELCNLVGSYYNVPAAGQSLTGVGSRFGADCTRLMRDTPWRPREGIGQIIAGMARAKERECGSQYGKEVPSLQRQ